MLNLLKAHFTTATRGFSTGQRVATIAAGAAVVMVTFTFASTAPKSLMVPAYEGLDRTQATEITETLRDVGIAYELEDRGAVILVASDVLHEAQRAVERAGVRNTSIVDSPDSWSARATSMGSDISRSSTERTAAVEESMASELLSLVEAVVGVGNVRVAVNAAINWDTTTEVREDLSPVLDGSGNQLQSASSIVVDSANSNAAQGILGSGDIFPIASGGAVHASVNADFLVDRVVTSTASNGGLVTALSASVVVDEAKISAEDLSVLETSIATATGLSTEDSSLSVAALAFHTPPDQNLVTASPAPDSSGYTVRLSVMTALITATGAISLWSFRKARKESATNSRYQQASELLEAQTEAPTHQVNARALNPIEHLAVISREHPQDVAELIGTWSSGGVH